jgi:VIT1/CCC1 family predicted Fe2+/Mn2+ transporter
MISAGLLSAVVWLVVAGLVLYVLWWGLSQLGLPEPFNKILRVVLVLITVVILINFLLGLTGTPLFR